MSDKTSFLLTDVLPYELPLIFSNKLLRDFVYNSPVWSQIKIHNIELTSTQPYSFSIWKNSESKRLMSLIHPIAQLQMLKFVEEYDSEFIEYFRLHATYSIRFPSGINSTVTSRADKHSRSIVFMLDEEAEYRNNEFDDHVDSYFAKKKFVKITDFYKSNLLKRYETKYGILLKMDLSNCFYNIYSHSIEWAYLGDKNLAKGLINQKKRFSYLLDRIMQASNWNETNGIVVGPEFSRCAAEIVLTGLDNSVFQALKVENLVYKHDYDIVRFIDDIFVFCNDPNVANVIKSVYEVQSLQYKLAINESKVKLEKRPFLRNNLWGNKIKGSLNKYFTDASTFDGFRDRARLFYSNTNLINDIKMLLNDYEGETHNIVSYVLSFVEKRTLRFLESDLSTMDEQFYTSVLCGVIDLLHYVLVYSITTPNVIKYSKLSWLIYQCAQKLNNSVITNLLFKKGLELLKFHQTQNVELLNLIILMRGFPKDIPEEVLSGFMDRDEQYFTLSTLSYYINAGTRKFRYKRLKSKINDKLQVILNELEDIYLSEGWNLKNLKNLVTSNDFYIIHDFYSNPLISNEAKTRIRKIGVQLVKVTKDLSNDKYGLLKIFIEFIKDFDKPFMNWNASEGEIINNLLKKSNVKTGSPISS